MTTLLHVEDDKAVAEMVHQAFETFGFRGTMIVAPTVASAEQILADVSRYPSIDLVLSDMRLPDGTGLEVVSRVRADPRRSRVPIIVLSGETDRRTVDRAYALGANSYVAKADALALPALRALYDHWLRDALLPSAVVPNRTKAVLARAVTVRARAADLFTRLSIAQADDPDQSAFWLSIALRHGNLANLISFLARQLGRREMSARLIDRLDVLQQQEARRIEIIERQLDEEPQRTPEIARNAVADLVSGFDPENFVQVTSELFPVVEPAVEAMREVVMVGLDNVITWFEMQPEDENDGARLERLRRITADLHHRLQVEPHPPHVN